MAQFGISGNPAVSAKWSDANLQDDRVKESNTRGRISFATAGPNTRTTQVFINLRDNSSALDSMGFAPFGQVTSGMDVVQQLYGGYGDLPEMGGRGPSEDAIAKSGKGYLDKNFPMLDSIKTATVSSPSSASSKTAGEHSSMSSGSPKP